MNSASLKYKSFFYSLAIHLALGIIVLSVYLQEDEKHEVYSLINLNSIQICTPDIEEPLVKEALKPKKKLKLKKEESKPEKKISKPIKKTVIVKKIAPLKSEPLRDLLVVKREMIEDKKEPEEEVEIQKEVIAEKEVRQNSPLVSLSEPKVSYEAKYMQDNIALINALIKKNLSYPRLAKKRGLQGKAMVSFTLNMEGEVLDIEALGILSSILKKSAIKTVRKASSSFPHPSQVLALRIPIVYKLH